jgi:dTDP-4-amino-4,6-dideoxygalactose transaminase
MIAAPHFDRLQRRRDHVSEDDEAVLYPVLAGVQERDRVRERLAPDFCTVAHYWPLPHLTPGYRVVGRRDGSLSVAEPLAVTALSLPLQPRLRVSICDGVAQSPRAALQK